MSNALSAILERWRLSALVASAGLLAIAHGFQTFGGFAPCVLCLRQREVYWAAIAVALIGMVVVRLPRGARWRAPVNGVLALVFVVGMGVAGYHAGVEWNWWPGPEVCAPAGGGVTPDAMAGLIEGKLIRPPACDEVVWSFAGLSMAAWNFLISTALAGLSVAAAMRERGKR